MFKRHEIQVLRRGGHTRRDLAERAGVGAKRATRRGPAVLSLEILRRAKLQGYRGGKTALYALDHTVRPVPVA